MVQLTEFSDTGAGLEENAADYLARARSISELISAEAAAGEQQGRLTEIANKAIIEAGLPWALVPKDLGGGGISDMLVALDLMEEISFADGSAGWVYMVVVIGASMQASCYPAELAEEMLGRPNRGLIAGQAAPNGRATKVDGGWLVNGRWQFGSGSAIATDIAGGCLEYTEDGEPVLVDGEPHWVFPLVPVDQVQLLGNWDVAGLRATASWDYGMDDVFVPDDRVVDLPTPPLYRTDTVHRLGFLTTVYAQHSAFTLGLVRRALHEVTRLVDGKMRPGYEGAVGDSQLFRFEFVQREAEFQAMRAYVRHVFAEAQANVTENGIREIDLERTKVTCAWLTRVSHDIINWAYSWGGSSAIRVPNAIARVQADMAVASNHLYIDRMNLVTGSDPILAEWR